MNSEKRCRVIVRERSQDICERCGRGGIITHHHRMKKGQGGKWCPANIVAACGTGTFPPDACHPFFEHHPKAAHAEGWHVKPWEDPIDIPVLYRGRWAYLTTEGTVDYDVPRQGETGI